MLKSVMIIMSKTKSYMVQINTSPILAFVGDIEILGDS